MRFALCVRLVRSNVVVVLAVALVTAGTESCRIVPESSVVGLHADKLLSCFGLLRRDCLLNGGQFFST